MNNKEDPNMGPWMNIPGTMDPWYSMPGAKQSTYYQKGMPPMMAGVMAYQMIYPEIFYKIQPFIMMVCDQMDMYGSMMMTPEMVENYTDRIYDDVCRMHPDLVEYANEYETRTTDAPLADSEVVGRRFRRRGPFKDLISILLLSELFRRRRRFY